MLAASMPPAYAIEPATEWRVENPRPFGHFIGDVVVRRIEFALPRPYALARDKLPAASRVNGYLELTRVEVQAAPAGTATRYSVELTYQIVNSPTQPLVTAIPSLNLHWNGGRASDATVDDWPLVIAPLSIEGIRDGLPALRAARTPRLIPTEAVRRRLVGAVVAAIGLLAYLVWRQWLGRRGSALPFAAAHRVVRAMARQPFTAERHHAALRAVHRAFDTAMGTRVFAEQLDEFIVRHPHFGMARAAATDFFAVSRAEFYGDEGSATDLAALLRWSAAFKSCECRGPAASSRAHTPNAAAV